MVIAIMDHRWYCSSFFSLVIWSLGPWPLGHLVTWSLSHLVINLFGRAHYDYAKFHYNHHRVQLVTWWLVTWSLTHLDYFPFKIVASIILFIIFFTGHLVTWSLSHLVTWSLSHLVINLFGRAHNNYAKFHYNHHRVQLVTWSLVTWSLITWSLSHLGINLSGGAHNYAKFHYNRISGLWTHRGQTNKQTNKHTCLFYIYRLSYLYRDHIEILERI
jgi:hypothetical protein